MPTPSKRPPSQRDKAAVRDAAAVRIADAQPEASMPKNVDDPILDLDDKPIKTTRKQGEDEVDFLIRHAMIDALMITPPNAADATTGEDKLKRFALARRINRGGEVTFQPDELALVKTLVDKMYGPVVVGRFAEWAQI